MRATVRDVIDRTHSVNARAERAGHELGLALGMDADLSDKAETFLEWMLGMDVFTIDGFAVLVRDVTRVGEPAP